MANLPCDEEAVFHAARRLRSPQERAEYLRGACGDDPALLARVEALLGVHDEDNSLAGVRLGPTADAVEAMPHPGALVGRYRLLEQIGEGGFGTVFMAEQQHPVRRRVALKVIKPGMDTRQVIARFEAERQALALMDHPNIAKVLDAGATDTGRPYFVMELVKGVPITDYCDQNNLSPCQRLELFVQVCHAVQHAHQKGVIHRDLKPGNVLVTLHDVRPVPKVIDFGIAKATGQQLTEKTLFTNFAQMVGTPLYMSPEQAALSAVDADTRSDVYSLGVLLYELLTGTTPFDKERLKRAAWDEVRRIIREEQPPKPSTRIGTLGATLTAVSGSRATEPKKLGPLVRGELDCIVMKALEKERTRRYETANDLAMDVKRYLSDEAVHARPTSTAYRTTKFVRKHKAAAFAAGAIAAALVLGIIGTSAGMVRATNERNRAVTLSRELDQQRLEALDAKARADGARATAVRDRATILASEADARLNQAHNRNIASFLWDMVALVGRNPGMTSEQLLDRAVAGIDRRNVPYHPRPDSTIRQALGTAYQGLGRLVEAEQQFRRAVKLHEDWGGANHLFVGVALKDLGSVLAEQGRLDEALPVLLRALDLLRTDSFKASDVLTTLLNLQRVSEAKGRHSEAAQYGREAAALRSKLGLDDPDPGLASTMQQVYERLERYDFGTAERLLRDGIDLHRRVKEGRDDLTLIALHHQLGGALATLGRLDDAEAPLRDALAASERLLGRNTPEAATMLGDLARVLRGQHKDNEARAVEIRCLGIQVLDTTLPDRAKAGAYYSRGHLLCRVGRFDEAVGDFAKAIELDANVHLPWYFHGCVLAYNGQAEAYRTHCGAMLRQFGGTTDRYVADRTAKTCFLLPDATPDLSGQLRLLNVALAPDEAESAQLWFQLLSGLAEYRQGNHVAAVKCLERGRAAFEGPFQPAHASATCLLAMAHHRLGHEEQAKTLFAEARTSMDREMPRAGVEDISRVNVEDWLICHVIRREADALFAGK